MSATRITMSTLVAGGLLAAGVAAAGALSATGALAASPSPTPSPSSSATPGAPGQPGKPGMGHRGFGPRGFGRFGGGPVLHGSFVTQNPSGSGTVTHQLQSGSISAKSGNTITVKSTDGFTETWTLNGSTTVRTGWNSGSVQDLAVGDQVMVQGTASGSGGVAQFVAERKAGAGQGFGERGPWGGKSPSGTPSPSSSGASFNVT